MNKVYALITSLLMIFGVGCEDTGNSDAKYKLLLSVVENGTTFSVKTYLGTVEADKKEKVIGYFNDAASVIQTAADSGQIEPEVFRKYVTEQIDKQVAAPYNAVIATTLDLALDGYNKFYAANVKDKIENEPKAKEIIVAIISGIHSGADPVGGDVLDTSNPLEGEIDWNL
jgi:hypothetical protein